MLLPLLTACQPIDTGKPNPKLSDTITFEVTHIHAPCDDHLKDCNPNMIVAADIHLEATSNTGVGGNNKNGTYPLNERINTPWKHTIHIEPGILVKAILTVTLNMQQGDEIICAVRAYGVDLPRVGYKATKRIEVGAILICGN